MAILFFWIDHWQFGQLRQSALVTGHPVRLRRIPGGHDGGGLETGGGGLASGGGGLASGGGGLAAGDGGLVTGGGGLVAGGGGFASRLFFFRILSKSMTFLSGHKSMPRTMQYILFSRVMWAGSVFWRIGLRSSITRSSATLSRTVLACSRSRVWPMKEASKY